MEELTATVLGVLYRAPEGGHTVARVRTAAGEFVTCAGGESTESPLAQDLAFRFVGRWVDHPKYGRQFRFDAAVLHCPVDRAGMIAYLVSLVDRVGQKRADRLWQLFGDQAAAVLRSDPDRVVSAGVLSQEDALAAQQILQQHENTERVRLELLSLVAGRGFGRRLVQESIGIWGARAAAVVRANPYHLFLRGLPGAGWGRTDKLWIDLGHPLMHPKRQVLAAVAYLEQGHGHTWHPAPSVASAITRACGPEADVKRALRVGERWRRLAIRRSGTDRHVALGEHARSEATAARVVKEMVGWSRCSNRPSTQCG